MGAIGISVRLCAAAFLTAAIGGALAQDSDKGRTQYMENCARCHGADASGAGPLSAKLKTKPTDLTLLAKRNHGSFDSTAVYQMIDGRNARATHRGAEMPIWGCRHQPPAVLAPAASSKNHRKIPKRVVSAMKGRESNSTAFSIFLAAPRKRCGTASSRSSIIWASCRRSNKVNDKP